MVVHGMFEQLQAKDYTEKAERQLIDTKKATLVLIFSSSGVNVLVLNGPSPVFFSAEQTPKNTDEGTCGANACWGWFIGGLCTQQ
eukprot:5540588-Amphidinium_carterae.1